MLRTLMSLMPLLALLASGCAAPPAETVPARMTPYLTPDSMVTRDGSHQPLASWLPDGRPEAVIIGLHSFGDYHAAFDHLGPWFAAQGMAFYAWDQRGFGAHPEAGHWPGDAPLITDTVDAIQLLDARWHAPIYLLGESMGGGVALITAAEYPALPIAGLALAAPSVRAGLRTRYLWNALFTVGGALMPGASYTLERDPDDPRYYPPSAERLANDPNVIHDVRLDTYRDLIRFTDRASDIAADVRAPMLLLYGGRDGMIPPVSITRLREAQPQRLTYHFYPDAPHLLLQAADWQRYGRDILQWIQQSVTGVAAAPTQQ